MGAGSSIVRAVAQKRSSGAAENPQPAPQDQGAEIERLHRLLDIQPSCLMRVAVDGTLLAVSDAALDMLGGPDLADVLGTTLLDRLTGDVHTLWSEFAQRVRESGSGSVECEMEDRAAGSRRTVVLLGVATPDHPDGLPSVLVAARDVSTARRLELSLQEQEGMRRSLQKSLTHATTTMHELRDRVDKLTEENRELRAALDGVAAERQQAAAAVEQLTRALNTAMEATMLARQLLARQAAE